MSTHVPVRRTPRLIAAAVGVTGLIVTMSACSSSKTTNVANTSAAAAGSSVVTLRVGTSNTFGWSSTFAANNQIDIPGFHFEIKPFVGGSSQEIQALNAGEIDIAELGEVGPVVAQAADVPFKIIAATVPWPKGQGIIVKGDSSIKSIADLKGKKVAYAPGTNSHWTVYQALKSVGLSLKDIESVQLPAGTNSQQVIDAGQIDAASAIDVQLSQFLNSGSRLLTDGTTIQANNPLYYIASNDAISGKKAAVAAFVKTLAQHIEWAKTHPEDRAKAVADLLKINVADALKAEKNRPTALHPIGPDLIANNQKISDAFLEAGVIKKAQKVDSAFTDEFNSSATP
ncbi:MAG: hypothetical protein JWM93_1595 [Frankiales bacterium]|nr:hypothetical protein [Frankiales bacterium]